MSPFAKISVIACDYDGTLSVDGTVADATLGQLKRAVESGLKLLLVTGRQLDDLLAIFPKPRLFVRVVAENGAVIYDPSRRVTKVLGFPPGDLFLSSLRNHGVEDISVGRVVVAAPSDYAEVIETTIKEMHIPYRVILNKDSAMVLPQGVDKGTGLQAALAELGMQRSSVAAIGDAENDIELFRDCAMGVAVANALPELKQIADVVTEHSAGAGAAQFIESVIENKAAYSSSFS